jgi:hypothetical protein
MKTNNYSRPVHLIFALADHFEPSFNPNGTGKSYSRLEQCRRLKRWCREYPNALARWRDVDGWPLRHTYFYPAEQYDNDQIKLLAEHCHEGWGEIEIHLHHGIDHPDTSENTRRRIMEFRDALASEGCLSFEHGQGKPRFAFVHGNWALANSAGGRWCGVDNELAILSDTGCYADLTLPSAPHMSQVAKINALYECSIPLGQRAPHRRGRDLTLGRLPRVFPLIIQGPLMLNSSVRKMLFFPSIENAEISNSNPATCGRLRLWRKAGITVRGRPDWVFIKLHTHGMDPRARDALIGPPMQRFLDSLLNPQGDKIVDHVHFVTAREMVNIALAACDGCEGNPGKYRDYIFQTIKGSLDPTKT